MHISMHYFICLNPVFCVTENAHIPGLNWFKLTSVFFSMNTRSVAALMFIILVEINLLMAY